MDARPTLKQNLLLNYKGNIISVDMEKKHARLVAFCFWATLTKFGLYEVRTTLFSRLANYYRCNTEERILKKMQ